MSRTEQDYFTRRADEERGRATSAKHPAAQAAHAALAEAYVARIVGQPASGTSILHDNPSGR